MNILIYLSISAGILLVAFLSLLIIANLKSNTIENRKKSQSYNASVLKKHIRSISKEE